MSGYKLRDLLENADFCNTLSNGGNAQLGFLENQQMSLNCGVKPGSTAAKCDKLSGYVGGQPTAGGVFDPSSASLRPNNIWDNDGSDAADEFNLEYMDLDEFLSETGLVDDQHFANMLGGTNSNGQSPSPLLSQQQRPDADVVVAKPQPIRQQQQPEVAKPLSNLEQLLMGEDESPVASPSSSQDGVVSVTEATQQVLPISPKKASPIKGAERTQITLTEDQIVKKRKYSEDGEGLTETSVVVVPGQEGFDPAAAKFAPEELQPQPIIKKSKKQFVPEDNKDEKYWKRRNKNNVAAKRSREARRAKENQIIMRAGFLETENERLTIANEDLIEENEKLKRIIEELRQQQQA